MENGKIKVDIIWVPLCIMDKLSDKAKTIQMDTCMATPAPIDYETALPQGIGNLIQQEDGIVVFANDHDQGFMANQAIVDF